MERKGFTLIEVLIALFVIGVVASLTLPNVSKNSSKKTYVSQLSEVHKAFSHAINQVLIDEREVSLADTIMAESAGDFLRKYMQIEVDCGAGDDSNCMASSYKSLDGNSSTSHSNIISNKLYCVKTVPGAVICMKNMSEDSGSIHGFSQVIVDINGQKKPNTNGRDLFQFEIYSDGKIGNGHELIEYKTSGKHCEDYADTAGYGGSCFQKIVADGWNMDY